MVEKEIMALVACQFNASWTQQAAGHQELVTCMQTSMCTETTTGIHGIYGPAATMPLTCPSRS